jgi:putative ABC transport system ATP-binding protein
MCLLQHRQSPSGGIFSIIGLKVLPNCLDTNTPRHEKKGSGDEAYFKLLPLINYTRSLMESAIQLIKVQKVIKLGERVLTIIKDIDLDIPRGQMMAIVGPSGSGKSTLMGIMGGLDKPSAGQVLIDGVDISDMNEVELTKIRNEKIGFVFQFFHLIPTLNALDNVALPLRFANKRKYNPTNRATEVLTLLGLGDRLDHRPGQLSGGQQQRVAIARALANDPPIILCDEPTGNLDTKTGQQIITTLQEVCATLNTTVIIVTHDPGIAQQTQRVITLIDGRIVDTQYTAETAPPAFKID